VRRAACRSLKEAGYTIALDDYVAHDRRVALVEIADIIIADIIKVEMHLTVAGGENRNAGRICDGAGSGVCNTSGIFWHPETRSTHDMPTNRMNYLGMLQEVSRPELELSELEKLVKAEASVCYRLLRYLNSTIFGWRAGRAAVGEAGGGGGCGAGKNSDLVLSALVRGRFGE
jgi:EAL and modified HD-GYP domain-containing signal transduction protein